MFYVSGSLNSNRLKRWLGRCTADCGESRELVMYHFCTYFNTGYLLRGIALYNSLQAQLNKPFVLWVLCFDDVSYDILSKLNLPGLKPIALADFERGDDALLAAKQTRSTVEYFFTCSPSLPLYVLKHNPAIKSITYVDADLYFFSDIQPVFDELGDGSILIIPHRFPEHQKENERNGVYNVGLLIFRNDSNGLECLRWWRERCLEWCYDRLEPGQFADQKYLDDWPTRFSGVVVSQHQGANLAPWNWMNYQIRLRNEQIWVDDQPLIFYHFQGMRFLTHRIYTPNVILYKSAMPPATLKLLYPPYVACLREALHQVRTVAPDFMHTPAGIMSRSFGIVMFVNNLIRKQYIRLSEPL